jgi:predicted dehydrogenase
MTNVLRAGVVGSGVFGGYHAQKYKQLETMGVEFIGVYDLDKARAEALAQSLGTQAFGGDELSKFLSLLDVVTIATPAFAHSDIGLLALEAGVHTYVEKPLAIEIDHGEAMVEKAKHNGLILACGHQERAVFEAMGLYDVPERPLKLEAVRNGTASARNLDVSVVLDLMIHDLDLGLTLAAGEAGGVIAEGKRKLEAGYVATGADEVRAEVMFDDGFSTIFKASRMADKRERTMRLTYPSGEVFVDLLNRKFENHTPFNLNPDFAEADIARDPLGTSVIRFLEAVKGDRGMPLCSGEAALEALYLALVIDEAALV